MKTLPKSLHTVTAWVNVARYLAKQGDLSAHAAVTAASFVLQLDEMTDTYDLRAAVTKQLSKG